MLQAQRQAKKCDSGKGNGMPGYNPPSAGVDHVEMVRLTNKLRQLEKGPEVTDEEIALMSQLFPERRRLIVNKKRSITDLKRDFRSLFSCAGVSYPKVDTSVRH